MKAPDVRVEGPADDFVSVSATYKYCGERKLRARRYACQSSAQRCAGRIQTQLYGHTIDLDIENCCAALVLQLLQKLKPNPPMPDAALQALQRWVVDSRASVCREELGVPLQEGKKLVTALLSGAAPSSSQATTNFVKNIQRASILPALASLLCAP